MESKLLPADNRKILLRSTALWQEKQALQAQMLHLLETCRHLLITQSGINAGKISRGENLEGCPWQILDFPKANLETARPWMRILIWWGHHVSFHWMIPPGYDMGSTFSEPDRYFSPDLLFKMQSGGHPLTSFKVMPEWQRIRRVYDWEVLDQMEAVITQAWSSLQELSAQ